MTGRKRDEFAWAQVEVLDKGWRCKYCRENYVGGVDKIKRHLAGAGQISKCAAVPQDIKDEARRRLAHRKRKFENNDVADPSDQETMRNSAVVASTVAPLVQIPSSSTATTSLPSSFSHLLTSVEGSENTDCVDGTFSDLDCENWPELFPSSTCTELGRESVVPCSSQNDQDHLIEENSGCTVMVYNQNQQSERTLGFYSPKGFLFAKAPAVLSIENVRDVFRDLTSNKGTVMHFMGHGKYGWSPTDQVCDLSDHESNSNWTDDDPGFAPKKFSCSGHEIERSLLDMCMKSVWTSDVISTTEQIHQLLDKLHQSRWFYRRLERGGFKELPSGERENHISRFLSIILLENDIRERVSVLIKRERGISYPLMELEAILQDSTFWEDGRGLKRVLSPILKIPYLMDTLVPAAGYLEMYMKAANNIVFNRNSQLPKSTDIFWARLNSYLIGIDHIKIRRPIATYLNPAYLWSEDAKNTIPPLKRIVEARLPNLVGKSEYADIEKELELYGDKSRSPFAPMFITLKSHHPIKLWQQYGNALPHLRNLAIQELSQPVSCMSNQVKKHMYKCEASEGDFLRHLNLGMGNEFRNMGDDIYKMVDLSLLHS